MSRVDRLTAMRRPGESYSGVILRVPAGRNSSVASSMQTHGQLRIAIKRTFALG